MRKFFLINIFGAQNFFGPTLLWVQNSIGPKLFSGPKINSNDNDLWSEKTKLLDLRLSKLAKEKVLF